MKEESKSVMDKLTEDSFQRVFWQQQLEAVSRDKKLVRWHPFMIRWCLYLVMSLARRMMYCENLVPLPLPSQRTLRDHTHYVRACTGFSDDVDQQLALAAKLTTCEEHEKLVILLLDEMHVQEYLVYDKNSGLLIGFSKLGDINNHLMDLRDSCSLLLLSEKMRVWQRLSWSLWCVAFLRSYNSHMHSFQL